MMKDKTENRFMDYQVLENIKCLEDKDIIIYGAGKYGWQAAEMLENLGFVQYNFCDRDINKQGINFKKGKIFSITEIEKRENLLIIVAIENENIRKEIEQTLAYIEKAKFFSFFGLKISYKYFVADPTILLPKAESYLCWYRRLENRTDFIRKACSHSVLVYQNGKVGSSTVSKSLWKAGIGNVDVHRFFFKKDIVEELIFGEELIKNLRKSNVFNFQSPEYIRSIREKIRYKKMITIVREPIAVDLSTVFQFIGSGVADRYFRSNLEQGKSFPQVVSELMVKIQDRQFEWFDEELKELSGVDVLMYPFDKEKGYTIISESKIEILLIKIEKISQMTDIIRDFIGSRQFELVNTNMGKDKEYAHIYKGVKKNLELPPKYIEYYYKDHPYMNHFYSKEEQKNFLDKWGVLNCSVFYRICMNNVIKLDVMFCVSLALINNFLSTIKCEKG